MINTSMMWILLIAGIFVVYYMVIVKDHENDE
jgi:hypothetical protein